MTEFDIAAAQGKYKLSYHVPYALEGQTRIGFAGKTVLEVGGALPQGFVLDDLKAARWIGLEEFGYYHDIAQDAETAPTVALKNVSSVTQLGDYAIVDGRIERLTPVFDNQFDAIFSIAAFEHIDRIPAALDRMYDVLKPGGAVFTMYSPIWSAFDGHHLHGVTAANGDVFNFHKSPIPPWGHLLYTPPEMFAYLQAHTDRKTAAEMVHQVYNAPSINRLFTEDYVGFFQQSRFAIEHLVGTYEQAVPDEVQKALEVRHPGRKKFDNNGIMAILRKPQA